MRGYPKHLNTKSDYERVIENFPREQWEPDLQALLDTRWVWLPTGELAEGDPGEFVEGEKTVIENDDGTRTQYEKQENQNAKIFRIGYTVAEVEELLV